MMALTRRLGPLQIAQRRAVGWLRRAAAVGATVVLLAPSLTLTGCQSASYERTSNGSTVYLDQLSAAAKAAAREHIVRTLSRGVGVYDLGIADEVEVFFHISRKPTSSQYAISPADKLQIDFLGDTQNSQTVQVRPDGRISLPLIGPVMAAGQTASGLARQLESRYSGLLVEPKITVTITLTHSPLDDFIAVLGSATKGRSLVAKVLPDGTIALPLLAPLPARGRNLQDLTHAIDAAYTAKSIDVSVSLIPQQLRSNATLVIGEVNKPGKYELKRPATVAMVVAEAGGVLTSGASDAVRVFYIGSDGAPRVRLIDLNEVMDDFKLEDDMIVPGNSIIYVPPTELAKTGRFLDATLRDILRYQGFSLGGSYSIE